MAFLKEPSNYKTSLLAQVKRLFGKRLYNDFKALLEPCCTVAVTYDTFTCASTDGVTGVKFENVTISFPKLANHTLQVFLISSTQPDGGVITTITLDSDGNWNGDLQTSWYNSTSAIDVQLIVMEETSRIVYKSAVASLTGVDNCD